MTPSEMWMLATLCSMIYEQPHSGSKTTSLRSYFTHASTISGYKTQNEWGVNIFPPSARSSSLWNFSINAWTHRRIWRSHSTVLKYFSFGILSPRSHDLSKLMKIKIRGREKQRRKEKKRERQGMKRVMFLYEGVGGGVGGRVCLLKEKYRNNQTHSHDSPERFIICHSCTSHTFSADLLGCTERLEGLVWFGA